MDALTAAWASWPLWVKSVVKAVVLLHWLLLNVLFLVWLERKVSAFIQRRLGPTRVGRFGWAQTIADGIKCMAKEDIIPARADKWMFILAPAVSVASALIVWVVIPFGPDRAVSTDMNIAIVYLAAATSFAVISVFMSGWGSDNKYSLLGAMRAAAQMISYEVPLVLSTMGVVMAAGTLSLQEIVYAQAERGFLGWFLFPQIVGFIVFLIAALAELNRAPFDLMEAESELIAGYHTEYSGIRWLLFMLAEYGHLLSWSSVAAALFLGGWTGPSPGALAALPYVGEYLQFLNFFNQGFWPYLFGFFWFFFKTYIFVFLAMWIRWTLPRIRIDQLMDLGWKFLLPVTLLNIFATGLWMLVGDGVKAAIFGG